jgi:hypothetical protein
MPLDERLDPVLVQSQQHGIPADRRAHERGLRDLPREQQLYDAADKLLWLPPEGFHRHDESEPRFSGIPDDMRYVPQHHELDQRNVQSQQHNVPADGRTYLGSVRVVPYQQRVRGHANGLLLVPPEGLHGDYQPESRFRRMADHLHDLPYDNGVVTCDLAEQLPHLLPLESRTRQRGLRDVPHELVNLLGVYVHELPRRQ